MGKSFLLPFAEFNFHLLIPSFKFLCASSVFSVSLW
jgi:hypothetical protein